jgi:transcription antitermination protein NusB
VSARAERRTSGRPAPEARHHAREAAVQMLYQWEVGRAPIADVVQTFWTREPNGTPPIADALQTFATKLASGVVSTVEQLDPMIGDAAEHWRIERMNVLDRLILRLAVYEFLYERGTPPKVVINEALELARTFSTDEAVKFINGILDSVRKRLEHQ